MIHNCYYWQDVHGPYELHDIGNLDLEEGGTIRGCQLAYATFGTLNAAKDNAILIPTWFASRADAWLPLLGPAGAVDTIGFYVIVIESLGAGSSSSPTTSRTQHGLAFPELTIGDMVEASYRLAHDVLRLQHVHAVVPRPDQAASADPEQPPPLAARLHAPAACASWCRTTMGSTVQVSRPWPR